MRGQEFRARDKKVQKMTRDGLTEKNLTAGTEQRISGRLADVSFGREKAEDAAAGHRAKSRTQKTMRGDGASARDTGKEAEGRNQSKAVQHRMAKEVAAAEERPDGEAAAMGENGLSDMPENGHICETDRVKPADASKIRADRKKRAAAKFSADSEKPEKSARLHYEKSEIPPEERAGEKVPEGEKAAGEKGAAKPRRIKQYEKAQRRVEKAEGKLIKAQENLPTRTHVRLQKERDGESGKVKRRLHFEKETIPENEKPPLIKRAGRADGRRVCRLKSTPENP